MRSKIVAMATQAFIYMNAKSYASIDMRADLNGKLFFLEINNQPTTFWHLPDNNSADASIKYNTLFKPEKVVYQIINLGLIEFEKKRLPYCVSFSQDMYKSQGELFVVLKVNMV